MTEIVQGVFNLLEQLIAIGDTHPEVLIATIALIAGAGLTCVLFCITVVLSIPFMTVRGLFGLIRWLWEIRHPETYYQNYYGYEDEDEDASDKQRKTRKGKTKKQEEPEELQPVLPHWLNQKGGRLL